MGCSILPDDNHGNGKAFYGDFLHLHLGSYAVGAPCSNRGHVRNGSDRDTREADCQCPDVAQSRRQRMATSDPKLPFRRSDSKSALAPGLDIRGLARLVSGPSMKR